MTSFISHRGSDSPQARKLADELRALGHEVWLDLDEIRPGESIVARMNEGLTSAGHLLLLYSDDATPGPWMDREWMSALARQLNGCEIDVMPIKVGHGYGPALLADIKYVDLVKDQCRLVNGSRKASDSTESLPGSGRFRVGQGLSA